MNKRIEKFGSNKVIKRQITSFCSMLVEPFKDTILLILIAACIVDSIVGVIENGLRGLVQGISIAIAVILIDIITALNNY